MNRMFRLPLQVWWLILLTSLTAAGFADAATLALAELVADRTAIERVYYEHRAGTTLPFEKLLPPTEVTRLVREDLKKETALKHVYSREVTAADISTEVDRINATTRAPEILAELKQALGNDPARFARSVAKPIVIDRALRARFENDDRLHAPTRHKMEELRRKVIAAKIKGASLDELMTVAKQSEPTASVAEISWSFTASATEHPALATVPQQRVASRGGPYSVEATVQLAQPFSSPTNTNADKLFPFQNLSAGLQQVARAQLISQGDISALIESNEGFALYVLRNKTDSAMDVIAISMAKRNFDEWLAAQPELHQ